MNNPDSSQDSARDTAAARAEKAAPRSVVDLDKTKRVMARLAALQEAELARQRTETSQARLKRTGTRGMPNVFDYWAYNRD